MKKKILLVVVIVAAILFMFWQVPNEPDQVLTAEVLKLEDLDERSGLRRITVRFDDGQERAIETYAPFFYKVGYSAHVAVHERHVFPDVYRIVNDGTE